MSCSHHHPAPAQGPSRRRLLRTLTLGGGAALLTTLPALDARAAGHVDVLLLSCMDYRLMDELAAYMDSRGLKDAYDHVILAGASLGALTEKRPSWERTFWQHLDVAIQLHHVKKVMVIDHRDCGAYRVFLGEEAVNAPEKELKAHTRYLDKLKAEIARRHERLEVELGLMSLDGSVQAIA
jgi:carbonic anhydrase